MIPPCDPTILQTNPQFKKLYNHLTLTLLNPDGSTRSNDALLERKGVVEELRNCQIRNAKKEIKKKALARVAFDLENGVSDECRDSLEVVTLYLESPSPLLSPSPPLESNGRGEEQDKGKDDTLSLLAPDIEAFYSSISSLTDPLSTVFATAINDLRIIANTPTSGTSHPESASSIPTRSTRSSRLTRTRQQKNTATSLSSQLSERMRTLRSTQLSSLPAARREMAATAAMVLATRTQVLERTVVLLERAKHGALARAMKAKAEHLATVAEGVEGKLSVLKLEVSATIYTPDTISALNKYRQHLRTVREELEERQALAIQELKAYGDTDIDIPGGSSENERPGDDESKGRANNNNNTGPMVEIARRYGTLMKEVETIRGEIKRLGG